ncbi:hypothetical protein [Scandinavium manionii]|uniref:hypothetical protein n=1 Tax=Scandinavium manionii TaxID=2926520 RepID=UPI00216688C0|nr:hypothetical protein [Scandinavium manionii]MCS2146803.1 hypothetical protein [Scandinavium manionii]
MLNYSEGVTPFKERNPKTLNTAERIIKIAELAEDIHAAEDRGAIKRYCLSIDSNYVTRSYFANNLSRLIAPSAGDRKERLNIIYTLLTKLTLEGYFVSGVSKQQGRIVYYLTGLHKDDAAAERLKEL